MNLQDISVLHTMKKNVETATKETIGKLAQEVPDLITLAETSPREVKLELLEISKALIDKLQECFPEVIKDDGWKQYEIIRDRLKIEIMETRFAVR